MSKVTPEHLTRQAIVYVRQSTADQVANNLESQRRQYGLVDRASLAGAISRLSTMISVALVQALLGPGSRSYWQLSVKAASAPWCRPRRLD